MPENINRGFATNTVNGRVAKQPAILRISSLAVAGVLAILLVTAVVPPIVADQSDRAVVNAPVTLLTAPIDGEVDLLSKNISHTVASGDSLARISNVRLDRGTLISLEEKIADARAKLEATREKKNSDRSYVKSLDSEINEQSEQLKAQFQSQIAELRARVSEAESMSGEKKALVDRQTSMVARNAASQDMLQPTLQQYSAALHKADAEKAKLSQKITQLDALTKGIYVGDDLVAIGTLVQKRRDIGLDATRMEIEEKELSAILHDQQSLADRERQRLETLAEADVRIPERGEILSVGVAPGRHVNAGDSVASLVDCDKRFVVAIFSYRQGQSMKVGTRVRVDGAAFGHGIVTAVLPKTTDKVDERFAVPFPQTERRELYAIIAPEDPGSRNDAAQTAAAIPDSTPCTVGQWVTVTKDNGIIPSMSVTWRRFETLITSWNDGSGDKTLAQSNGGEAARSNDDQENKRRRGIAALAASLRAADPLARQAPGAEDRTSPADAVASR